MKIKKSELVTKESRERADALSIARTTAQNLSALQKKFEDSELSLKEYFDQTSNTIQQALQSFSEAALLQPEIDVNLEPLNELLKETFEKFGSTIIDIQNAVASIEIPQPNIEFNPDIKVKTPEVDLKGLEELLRVELPKIFLEFAKALPKQKPLDLKPLDQKFDKIVTLLTAIKDKKMPMFVGGGGGNTPLVQTPSGVAVPIANPDGSEFTPGGSSLAKPTDKYKYSAEAVNGGYEYLFYEDKDGNWYISREETSTGYIDFASGDGGIASVYVDNTSAPSGSLSFDTYANVF